MKKLLPSCLSIGILALLPMQAKASLTFVFDYTTNGADGAGFFDTAAKKASLEDAAATVGSWFGHTATINMAVTASNNTSNNLASAGTAYTTSTGNGFDNRGVIPQLIISNGAEDKNGSAADGTVDVNFGQTWHFGDSVGAGEFDFKSTAIHELLHAVGFASSITQTGGDGFGGTSGPGQWEIFDKYVGDINGTMIDQNSFELDQSRWDVASVGGSGPTGGLFFYGPAAMAANGGTAIPLFSPSTITAENPTGWADGSSGSHTDDEFYFPGQNLLMGAETPSGPASRTMTAFERGMLIDLGYTIVPEPSSALLLSLGAFGFFIRRRRA